MTPDSDVADATTITHVSNTAADALQELEMTKKHLDTIIEAQSKRAESSKLFDSQLHPRDMDVSTFFSSVTYDRMNSFRLTEALPLLLDLG